jgi:hypothetical protein
VFEPGTATSDRVTAEFQDNCGTGGTATQHFSVTSVKIDVEGAQ